MKIVFVENMECLSTCLGLFNAQNRILNFYNFFRYVNSSCFCQNNLTENLKKKIPSHEDFLRYLLPNVGNRDKKLSQRREKILMETTHLCESEHFLCHGNFDKKC